MGVVDVASPGSTSAVRSKGFIYSLTQGIYWQVMDNHGDLEPQMSSSGERGKCLTSHQWEGNVPPPLTSSLPQIMSGTAHDPGLRANTCCQSVHMAKTPVVKMLCVLSVYIHLFLHFWRLG